ncbi:MAG: transglutaminaseTgpA domain-containing protein, partial [Ilumatobacteraceae bacterium]
MSEPNQRLHALPLGRDVIATIVVAAFSLAVAVGYVRVFSGWHFMDDMVVIVVVGHGAGLLLRRLRVAGWIAAPIMVALTIWAIAALFYRDTFAWGLPTSETWSLFQLELHDVREQFRFAVAPVVYGGGWDVLAAIGLGLSVILADMFAFRAMARAETLVPGGVLFVFVGALGDDRLRVASTVVLVGTGVLTTIVLRAFYSTDVARSHTGAPLRRVVPAALAAVIVVAVGAGYVGPRLPGATADALYETHGRGGGVTEVVSPLVDIRSRLTNRSDAELFQVQANIESYWRSATLSDFDGTV